MSTARKPRPVVVVLALLLLTMLPVVVIVAVEALGRVAIWWNYGEPGHSYGIYAAHPVLGGMLGPRGYNTGGKVTNGQAFQRRSETDRTPPADRTRVIAYGGSTVFAHNLPTGLDWPQLVEAKAATAGRKLEILNAGDINWTVHHALARSKEDIPVFRPDVIMLYEGINEERNYQELMMAGADLPSRMSAGDFRAFSTNFPQCSWFYRNSLIYKFFGQIVTPAIDNFFDIGAAPVEREINRELNPDVARFYRGGVATAIDEWRAAGARVIYVIQAHGHNAARSYRLTGYSRDAAETARTHGALVIDSQEVVAAYMAGGGKASDLFMPSGVHWSEKGSHLIAQFVFDEVEAAGGWRLDRRVAR